MTKTTIYLAKIIKPNDYATDIAVALEAFDSMDKAKGFMEANGMVEMSWGWVMTIIPYITLYDKQRTHSDKGSPEA
jgi:hypothetical protein